MKMSRSRHEDHSRQPVEEENSNEMWHPVSPRRPEVPVDDDDRDQNGDDVHDKREEQVLGDQWNVVRSRWKDLGNEQKENDKGEQDRDTHRHLLAGISGQIEDADGEK